MTINLIKSEILKGRHSLLLFILLFNLSCSRENITDSQDDNLPPPVPVNVNIFSAHDGAIGIEWEIPLTASIKGYNIYRKVNNSSFAKLSFTTGSYFTDYPLKYDSVYHYAVTAINKRDEESAFSKEVYAKPVNRYSPAPIYDISINGCNDNQSTYMYLSWIPQDDHDIQEYEIYRAEVPDVKIEPGNLAGYSSSTAFYDYNATVLKTYYYKVISVDKGGLKSEYSPVVKDIILDSPELISPADNAVVKNLSTLQFRTTSEAAIYKIVIQANELYGTVAEFTFSSDKIKEIISYAFSSNVLNSYHKYYWRVIAYSGNSDKPNSYTPLNSFTFIAE